MYILTIFSVDRQIENSKTRGASERTLNSHQFKRNPRSIALKLRKIQRLEDKMPEKGFGIYENDLLSSSSSHF